MSSGKLVSLFLHPFEMEFDSLFHVPLNLIPCRTCGDTSIKIGLISGKPRSSFFDNDKIFHFNPACLIITFQIPGIPGSGQAIDINMITPQKILFFKAISLFLASKRSI